MSTPITRNVLLRELSRYGFAEVGDVVRFLQVICTTVPDYAAILYMQERLGECLKNHDNGSDWFVGLRDVVWHLEAAAEAASVRDPD